MMAIIRKLGIVARAGPMNLPFATEFGRPARLTPVAGRSDVGDNASVIAVGEPHG